MVLCTIRTRTHATHGLRVPSEILDAVLDYFLDTPNLCNFSRVCRAWKPSCYRILFNAVRFKDGPDHDTDRITSTGSTDTQTETTCDPPARVLVSKDESGEAALAPRFEDLLAFLERSPDVCPHVRRLYLVGTCTPGAILSSSQSGLRLDLLQKILARVPAVQVLSIHFLHLLPSVPWSPIIERRSLGELTSSDGERASEPPESQIYRTKLRRLHIGYLDSPPNEADGVVHVLDILDLFDEIETLDLDCMLIPERAMRFALPSDGLPLIHRSSPLCVSSLVFGEHCSPSMINLLVNVMENLLQPDTLTSLDVQLARNSSRFISDILPNLDKFLHSAVHNLRSFTCDISGGRYLKPDDETTGNDDLVHAALMCCSHLETITLFLVIRADGASYAACRRGWNSCMNLLYSAASSSRVLSRVNIAFLACDCDGDYCQEKTAFLENIGLLDWTRVDTFVDRCSSSLRQVTLKAMDGPYRKKGSFSEWDTAIGDLGLKVLGVVRRRVSKRTQTVLRCL